MTDLEKFKAKLESNGIEHTILQTEDLTEIHVPAYRTRDCMIYSFARFDLAGSMTAMGRGGMASP